MGILAFMTLSILVLLAMGISIAVSLGAPGLGWLVLINPAHLRGAADALWNTADSYLLMAVPLFILMGEIIQRSDIATRFYRSMSKWVTWLPGGLLHSNIGACALFSAVSGSSVATAATIGTAAIPDLLRLGYPRRLVFGSLSAGGTLGILIPPSIPLIIYASLTDVSLGRLFLGALFPGIVLAIMFSLYLIIASMLEGDKSAAQLRRDTLNLERITVWRSLVDIVPIALIFVIIIGGIYTGWATPTEVAALGVVAALIVAALIGKLNWVTFRDAVAASTKFTGMIIFVVIGAQIFSYALFVWGVPREVSAWVGTQDTSPYIVFLYICIMYLLLGMFIDAISMMVLTIAVVFPIIINLGFDPVWFGVVLVILLEVGLLTPPVGINLYTIQGVAPPGTTLSEVAAGAVPFILLLILGIVVLTAFPALAVWLPNQLYN